MIVFLQGDLTMEVVVKENEPTGCDSDEWAEAIVTGSPMDQWEIIKSLEQSVLISMNKIRVSYYLYFLKNIHRLR